MDRPTLSWATLGSHSTISSPVSRSAWSTQEQRGPHFDQGRPVAKEEPLEDTWVTIFGFPPSTTSYVLQQFQAFGDILRHEVGEGNWINVQYASPLQAIKALNRNGKFIGDSILIGVLPTRKLQRE